MPKSRDFIPLTDFFPKTRVFFPNVRDLFPMTDFFFQGLIFFKQQENFAKDE
jgi:hypothetical protein